MLVTREAIAEALFTLLKGMNGVKTFSRRFQTYDGIAAAEMPYLIQCSPKEMYGPRDIVRLPAKREMQVEVIIWFNDGQNQKSTPDKTINQLMDNIDTVLAPRPPLEAQTLGGLVNHCYIEGEITKVPGDLDGVGMLYVPLKILIP